MGILIPLVIIFFTCLLIWRACDGFEVASGYIGRNLSEGVRGGTINAIASSLPELFTTLFALFVLSDRDGFSVGIGTTAGSALFNGMIIPAFCILSVVGAVVMGKRVATVGVMPKVILRDGLALIFCEFVLVLCISGTTLSWWQGALLMGLYVTYLAYMILSMKAKSPQAEDEGDEEEEDEDGPMGPAARVFYWLSFGPLLDLENLFVKEKHKKQIKDETWNAWPLLLMATIVIGAACFSLVFACEWLGSGEGGTSYTLFGQEFRGLGMPTMFVAVIFASMATSVPDTVISIRDARKGEYDDAVANALGSNLFDICFALGFPLFLYTMLNGPITMSEEIAAQSAELRLLLLILTIFGFCVYFFGARTKGKDGQSLISMGRGKAAILLGVYAIFVAYVVGRGADEAWARKISDTLATISSYLPTIG